MHVRCKKLLNADRGSLFRETPGVCFPKYLAAFSDFRESRCGEGAEEEKLSTLGKLRFPFLDGGGGGGAAGGGADPFKLEFKNSVQKLAIRIRCFLHQAGRQASRLVGRGYMIPVHGLLTSFLKH